MSEDERIEIFTNKLDLTLPYEFATLEFGGKISNIKNKNNLSYKEQSSTGMFNSNLFDYTENTQSLYGSAARDFSQWSIQLSLRMETTQTIGKSSVQTQTQKNNYFQLFPTFYLKRTLNKNNVFSFTYGRITAIQRMNIFCAITYCNNLLCSYFKK